MRGGREEKTGNMIKMFLYVYHLSLYTHTRPLINKVAAGGSAVVICECLCE
jgi:hypothetical protein